MISQIEWREFLECTQRNEDRHQALNPSVPGMAMCARRKGQVNVYVHESLLNRF